MGWDLSQSALSIYYNCPYAYKIHYLDKEEAVFWNPDALDVGGIVHDTIDDYYKHYHLLKGSPEDVFSRTYDIFKKRWEPTYSIDDYKKAFTSLQNHSGWESKNISMGVGMNPISELDVRYGGYHGILDYVDRERCIVVDWKTNKYPTISYSYRMQAYVYKTLFEGKYGEKLKHFYFYFLYPDRIKEISYDDRKQIEVGKQVEELKEKVLSSLRNENFEKKPRLDSGCRNCGYKLYCKFGGG